MKLDAEKVKTAATLNWMITVVVVWLYYFGGSAAGLGVDDHFLTSGRWNFNTYRQSRYNLPLKSAGGCITMAVTLLAIGYALASMLKTNFRIHRRFAALFAGSQIIPTLLARSPTS